MNNLELLPPDNLQQQMQSYSERLFSAIIHLRASLAKSPAGRLRTATRGNKARFYHVTDPKKPGGSYIPRHEESLAAKLAQKDYESTVLAKMERHLELINQFIEDYAPQALDDAFASLSDCRRQFVTPVSLPNEEYAKRWLACPYKGKPFLDNAPEYTTAHGERVRSKSEVIIADTLLRMGIPYRYEFPLKLKMPHEKSATFFPDFTCLNLRTREEFLWEHFGMMDDSDYVHKAMHKLDNYERNGIFPGKRLIVSRETAEKPLNAKTIRNLAEEYLR
ncbi:MAG: hypothetical protein J5791_09415 [Fibrobacter sp.]|nr:hypothetical protein [Fibrobacter sp.]